MRNVEITESTNIDSLLSYNKKSITTDERITSNNQNPFVTQSELDSLKDLQTRKNQNNQLEETHILDNIKKMNQPITALNNLNDDSETDSLFKIVAEKIKNRDNEEPKNSLTQDQPTQSALDKRRNSLAKSWNNSSDKVNNNLIPAVIHKTQTIKNNQTVTIRTKAEFSYNNIEIPKNTLITGVAIFSNNRLNITIRNIRLNDNLIVANIAVYGSDGIAGLEVSTNVVKKSIDEDVTQEISTEVNSALSKVGNEVGKIVGSLVGQTIKTVGNEKQQQVTLIDNQTIYLSIN